MIGLLTALPDLVNGAPPTEFRIFPWGKHTSEKGEFVFTKQSAEDVIAAFNRKGHDMPMDYEHNMVKPAEKTPGDGPTPAAAWFKLEVRGKPNDPEGGLFAVDVKWTPRATAYLSGKEYRHYSPAFLFDQKTRRIVELINVALTNTPAQHDQQPLVAAKDDGETEEPPEMKTLLALLKLSPEATEADVLREFENIRAAGQQAVQQLKQLVELSGKKDADEARGVFAAWKVGFESAEKIQSEVKEAKHAKRKSIVSRLVKQGMTDKQIAPTLKKTYIRFGMQKGGVKFLKAFLATAPRLVGGKGPKAGKSGSTADLETILATLTDDEKKIAADAGVSFEDYAKTKLKHSAGIPTGEGRQ